MIVDTSSLNIHELRDRLTAQFSEEEMARPMRVSIRSFGFKNGTPRDIDLLLRREIPPQPALIPEPAPAAGH